MESNKDLITNEDLEPNPLSKDEVSNQELYIILKLAEWSKILAVTMLVIISFMVFISIATFAPFSFLSSYIVIFLGLYFSFQTALGGIFYLIPTYYLFQFSKQVKNMNDLNDRFQINAAFKSLRLFFKSFILLSLIFIVLKLLLLLAIFI